MNFIRELNLETTASYDRQRARETLKIAIVGAGITGLGAALALSEKHNVYVFERENRVGGHANTALVSFGNDLQPVDTGFIVFNERNYPNLCALFEHLNVPTQPSDMSFGFSLKNGAFEYACDSLDTIFAQRLRVADPRFLRTFSEVLRFTKFAPKAYEQGELNGLSLGQWLDECGFSHWFKERFLLPMGSAIWSTTPTRMLDFPAENFVRFFVNHDLMTGLNPAQSWRTVTGGSQTYVKRLMAKLGPRVRIGHAVSAVDQSGEHPVLHFERGPAQKFDQVILACHGPQASTLLKGQDADQSAILSSFKTTSNQAFLHADPSLMPKRKKVWSSWNFVSDDAATQAGHPAQVTYWMNRLQGIRPERPLFVSLNPAREPDVRLTHAQFTYAHPLFDQASFTAQARIAEIQGRNGVWFAGAWLGNGFHEDGLRSGLQVAAALGVRPVWARDTGTALLAPVRQAAV